MKKSENKSEDASLRQKAEALLKSKTTPPGGEPKQNDASISEADTLRLIHELEVHQIELEMQNEELTLASEQAEIITQKFTELYDFAPTGYFTLSPRGEILGLNLTGANMLGKERSRLINSRFHFFLSDNTKPAFALFLKKAIDGKSTESCDVVIEIDEAPPTYVHLVGIASENLEQLLITAIDITERKKAEDDLRESEMRFQNMADTAPVLLWMSGTDSLCNYFNKVWLNFTGRSFEQELGNGWAEGVHPDDLPRCLDIYLNAFKAKRNFTMDYRLRRYDGEYRWIIDNGVPRLTPDGIFLGFIGSCSDIHDKKIADEALRESEEQHRLLVANSHDVIYLLNIDGMFTYVSPAWEELLGNPASEVTGQSFTKFVHPEDLPGCFVFLQKLVDLKQRQQGVEYRVRHLDGTWRWHTSSAIPLMDASGNVISIEGIARDITERKQAEAALRESEEKYRRLFEAVSDSIFIIHGGTGEILEANFTAVETYGYSREELLSKRNIDLSAEPEKTNEATKKVAQYIPIRWHKKKDGTVFPVEITSSGMTWNSIPAIIAAVRDITKRRAIEDALLRSEENYRIITDQSPIAIELYDAKGFLIRANPACLELFGVLDESEISKFSLFADPNVSQNYKDELLSGKAVRYQVDFDFGKVREFFLYKTTRTGTSYLDIMITPTKDENQKLSGYLVQIQDITHRMDMEKELTQKNEQLSASNAVKDKFFSIIAHDLRGPFHPLLGISALLRDNYETLPPEEIGKYSDAIYSIAKRVFGLLQNLLEWAGAQSGKVQNNPTHINLAVMTSEILQSIDENCRHKHLAIFNQIDIGLTAFGDEHMVSSVLQNLLTNAIKFTPEFGSITVQAHVKEFEDAEMIEVSVSDTGVGIAKERLDRLFSAEKYETTRGTNNEEGSGLGLALCKEFVDQLGGKLWVKSNFGVGSTFYFTLKKA